MATISRARLVMAAFLPILALSITFTPPAQSSSKQLSIIRDDRQFVSSGAAARERALNDVQALGVDVVQIMVNWNQYVPNPSSKNKPSFNDKDSKFYGSFMWGELDAAVRGIVARGMIPMLNPTGQAPRWASTNKKNNKFYGRYPNLKLFSNFSRAVARRYNGKFDPGDGSGTVPRVKWWGSWNEPDIAGWLQPQWRYSKTVRARIPRSPHLYRSLFTRTEKEVRKAGIRNAKMLVGETSPLGKKGKRATSSVHPKRWWREFFCLDERSRTLKGAQRRARGCPAKFKKIKASGIAHHPYTRGGARSPWSSGDSKLDVTLAQVNGLVAILNRAGSARRIRKKAPIYFTEYGLQTNPPDNYLSVSLSKQASFINTAEYIGYRNGRVRGYSQYPLVDDPLDYSQPASTPKRNAGFQSGIRFDDYRAKPSYNAYRLPIFVTKKFKNGTFKNKVMVWGAVRPNERATVEIQSTTRSGYKTRSTVTVRKSKKYFRKNVRLTGASSKRWRLRWVDKNGVEHLSRGSRVSKKR